MKKFIYNLLADERGSVSHKRVLSMICILCLCGVFLVTRTTEMAYLVFYAGLALAGLTTVDKFTK